MDIVLYMFDYDNNIMNKSNSYEYFTIDLLYKYIHSGPLSMKKCINDNLEKFTDGEKEFLYALLSDINDRANLIMAYEIIKNRD